MNRFRVAVVDDEDGPASTLCQMLEKFAAENNLSLKIERFADGAKLVGHYRQEWDLLMLDVMMPVMDGFKTARYVRRVDPEVPIIFITNLSQYAIKGYEVDALDYVIKPLNYYALSMKLKKVLRLLRIRETESLLLKKDGDLVRIPVSHIYYIEVSSHKLVFHTFDDTFETNGTYTLSKLEEEMSGQGFIRCSNSHLVNIRYIDAVRENSLSLCGTELPISRGRRKETMEALLQYVKGE